MHIDDDHRQYGSAIIQIAENRHPTAINAFKYKAYVPLCLLYQSGYRARRALSKQAHGQDESSLQVRLQCRESSRVEADEEATGEGFPGTYMRLQSRNLLPAI